MTNIFISLLLLSSSITCSYGSRIQYTVGDSIWSIPPSNDFYANWSSSYSFHIGDTLYFDFSSGLYDVIQVSRGEYDSCSSNQAFKVFMEGPIDFPLVQKGVSYFICNISNYSVRTESQCCRRGDDECSNPIFSISGSEFTSGEWSSFGPKSLMEFNEMLSVSYFPV